MLTYINSFLLGGDVIAIQVGPISVRLLALTLLIGLIPYFVRHKSLFLSRDQIFIYLLFVSAITLSIPQSLDPVRSVAYLFWMIFLGVIQTSYYNFEYRRRGEEDFERIMLNVYRFCTVALFLEFILRMVIGDGSRPRLFFYEPAHTAIFMIPYLVIAVINASARKMTRDVFLALGAMLILFSATAFFSTVGALAITALFVRKTRLTIFSVGALTAAVILGIILATGLNEQINLMIGFLASAEDLSNAFELILHRSGTRVIRFYYGIEAFHSSPWLGIGAGAANTYTSINDIPSDAMTYFDPEWDDVVANPFVNPFVEVAATMGILGAIAFIVLIIRLTTIAINSGFRQKMAISALAMFVGIMLESTFLRHYIWFAVSLALISTRSPRSLKTTRRGSI